jgi:hypothetical protein
MKLIDWIFDRIEAIGIITVVAVFSGVLLTISVTESDTDRLKRIETKLNAILNQEQINQSRIMGLSIQIDKLRVFPEMDGSGPFRHFTYPIEHFLTNVPTPNDWMSTTNVVITNAINLTVPYVR